MTSTEETQTCATMTTTDASLVDGAAAGPNIKRHVSLYHYGLSASKIPPLRRLLAKKCWKEVKAIIYDDSTMKVFEDSKLRDPLLDVKLAGAALDMAFGRAANKYGPPAISEEESNFVSPNNFFALPEKKELDKVHWFAAKDECVWRDLIQAIAETMEGKANPPQLGKGPKFRAFDQHESKWKTYWLACAQQPNPFELAGENGSEPKYVATPLVAVMEQKKHLTEEKPTPKMEEQKTTVQEEKKEEKPASPPAPAKNGLFKKPIPLLRHHPSRDYYKLECEMPEAGDLNFEMDQGLVEEKEPAEKKTMIVRLVSGKRVREIITEKKAEAQESSPSPPNYPPPPVPMEKIEEKTENKKEQIEQNIGTLVIEHSNLVPFESVDAAKAPPQGEENVEIFTSQHSAFVNTANTEHTISTTEYHVNGCTTTKESATYQITTEPTPVH